MIDGISISQQLHKAINHKSLDPIGSSIYGKSYKLKTSSNAKYSRSGLVVSISPNNKLTIKGSLPYLLNDNNLVPFSLGEVRESISDLSYRLGIDLSEATVNNFEFGVAVVIPFSFKEFIHHHLILPKMDFSFFKNKGKYFQSKEKQIKLYDAGRNARFKLSSAVRRELLSKGQYNKKADYAKFEIHYKNPAKYFKQVITVNDLMDVDFLGKCAEDLLDTYRRINKTGFTIPIKAKKLSTNKIFAIALKEAEQMTGIDMEYRVEEIVKTLHILNSDQKYTRRQSIKRAFNALNSLSMNPYDITTLLEEATKNFLQSVV